VLDLLDTAARDRVLAGKMLSGQAYYEQGWNLGAWAVAYLKVRGSNLSAPDQAKKITSWFKEMAEQNRDYYDHKSRNPHSDAHNNHEYWAGLAIAAAAVSCDDHKLFNWAMDAYKDGVRQITPEGTLPLEMNRAARALHYHLYALAPLVMIAEFGAANGLDLYAERDFAIKRLVSRSVAGLQDHTYFVRSTGEQQDLPDTIGGFEIGWAVPYVRRFPDPQISALLAQARTTGYTTWGGAPPE
jgi:poly(beta-D-mannuronate) lyase